MIPPKMVRCPTTNAVMKAMTRTATASIPMAADATVPMAVHLVKLFWRFNHACIGTSSPRWLDWAFLPWFGLYRRGL